MVKPQCIVQGLGVVLNHAKEGALHWDLRSGERSLWYTTTGWMMWNWLLGASCPPSAYAWLSSEKPNVGLYLDERWHGPQRVLQRYRTAYFDDSLGHSLIWKHSDYCEPTQHGGLVIHGESDTTLKPGGVRIGTAEIYSAIEPLLDASPDFSDALVSAQAFFGNCK